jgi:Fibronectin type III domain
MTTKVKKLKALLGSHGTSDADLLKQFTTVHDHMNGNSKFPTPPVDMPTFKSGIDLFNTLVVDAADGGKKAKSAKNKQREVMLKQYTLLGHYVEAACDDDLATFNTSGFVAAPASRTPPQPLPPASFEWIDRGPTAGTVVVKVKGLPKAINYELQYSLVAAAGAPASPWISQTLPGSKKVIIPNLTPGGKYAFQVRALGRLGYTDWSDPMTFICG